MDEPQTEMPRTGTEPGTAWKRPYYTIIVGQAVSQVEAQPCNSH